MYKKAKTQYIIYNIDNYVSIGLVCANFKLKQ